MSEEINRVKVFQDVVGDWWLEFWANDVRHQVTIQDVINGLALWVNMQATNAVLHEKINEEAAQQGVEPTFDNVGEKSTVSKSYQNELPE